MTLSLTLTGAALLAIPTIAFGLFLGRVLGISGMLGNPLADKKKFLFTVSLAVGGYVASIYNLGNPLD